MITVLSGTNRKQNKTLTFAEKYCERLKIKGQNYQLFSLEDLPDDFSLSQMYDYSHPGIQLLIEKYLISVDKLVIISPEYNGSFPGVLKVFIDSVKPSYFKDKKIALVGISEGRSGNLRGMDNLTNILHYVNAEVLSYKLPVSKISSILKEGVIEDENLVSAFDLQIDRLLSM